MMQTSETLDNIIEHILVAQLRICAVCVVCAVASLGGCSKSDVGEFEKGGRVPERTIQQVQEAHTNEWMPIPGVEGTAIGLFDGKPCIKVFSSRKASELRDKIPSVVEGYPVIIEETGTFRALDRR